MRSLWKQIKQAAGKYRRSMFSTLQRGLGEHTSPLVKDPLGYHKEGYSATLHEQTEETVEVESNLVRSLCAVLCPQNEALKG